MTKRGGGVAAAAAVFVAVLLVCPAWGFNMKAFKEEFGKKLKGSTGTQTGGKSETYANRKGSDGLLDKSGNVVTGTPLDTPIPEALGGNNGVSIYTGFQVFEKFLNRFGHLVFGTELKNFDSVSAVYSSPNDGARRQSESSSARPRRGSSSEIVTGCEPGYVVNTVGDVDTCKNGKKCYVHKVSCTSDITINMETTTAKQLMDYGDKCNVTQAICDGIVVDFKDQFDLDSCVVQEIYCTRAVPISECSIKIGCPDSTTYGEKGFGRIDMNYSDLVCNGEIEESPLLYNGRELPKKCEIKSNTCDPTTSTCYTISCTGSPCVLDVVSSTKLCSRYMKASSCVCPTDRKGDTCDDYEPLVWSSKITIPKKKKVVQEESKDDKLTYDRSLFSVTVKEGKNLSLYVRVNCSFENINAAKDLAGFNYWISADNLLVYKDPSWVLQAKIFNFNSISSAGRVYKETLMSQNIVGKESVVFTIPTKDITSEYVYGGRAYMEIGFGENNYPPGFKNMQLQRVFFDVNFEK